MRHSSFQIGQIFDTLYQYSHEKSKAAANTIDQDGYDDACIKLAGGCTYIDDKSNNIVYLGWTPFADVSDTDAASDEYKILRNDNKITRADRSLKVDWRHIPLYFIFINVLAHSKTLSIERIYANPSIDVKVNISHLKDHLHILAHDSNTTLSFTKLHKFDNGRWYMEFMV